MSHTSRGPDMRKRHHETRGSRRTPVLARQMACPAAARRCPVGSPGLRLSRAVHAHAAAVPLMSMPTSASVSEANNPSSDASCIKIAVLKQAAKVCRQNQASSPGATPRQPQAARASTRSDSLSPLSPAQVHLERQYSRLAQNEHCRLDEPHKRHTCAALHIQAQHVLLNALDHT